MDPARSGPLRRVALLLTIRGIAGQIVIRPGGRKNPGDRGKSVPTGVDYDLPDRD